MSGSLNPEPDPLAEHPLVRAHPALANDIAAAVIRHCDWQPLSVRYGLAEAVLGLPVIKRALAREAELRDKANRWAYKFTLLAREFQMAVPDVGAVMAARQRIAAACEREFPTSPRAHLIGCIHDDAAHDGPCPTREVGFVSVGAESSTTPWGVDVCADCPDGPCEPFCVAVPLPIPEPPPPAVCSTCGAAYSDEITTCSNGFHYRAGSPIPGEPPPACAHRCPGHHIGAGYSNGGLKANCHNCRGCDECVAPSVPGEPT